MAQKQAEFYHEVSAKTNANIEDLFNKVIDDLQATQNKKKETVATNPTAVEPEANPAKEENKKIKLGSANSKKLEKEGGWANCCQR